MQNVIILDINWLLKFGPIKSQLMYFEILDKMIIFLKGSSMVKKPQ